MIDKIEINGLRGFGENKEIIFFQNPME